MLKLIPKLTIAMLIVTSVFASRSAFAHVYDFTDNNKLTLLQNPKDSADFKLDLIRNAKHHIHIMTYYLDKSDFSLQVASELKKAHDRGVDVRVMTTYLPSLATDFTHKTEDVLMLGDPDQGTSTLAYLTLVPGNNEGVTNNLHEKIFLVDGQRAILGGRNVSGNDFKAKDMEVLLEGPIVNQVQQHFKLMFDFLTNLKIINSCGEKLNPKNDLCRKMFNHMKFAIDDATYFPFQPQFTNGARARILTNEAIIQQYQNDYSGKDRFNMPDDIIDTVVKMDFTKMRAYNYFVIPTDRYRKFLYNKLSEGKSIDMITNSMSSAAFISDKGYLFGLPEMYDLVKRGLNLYQWQSNKEGDLDLSYLHEKVMFFDDNHGLIGSHNYGAGSTSVSSEIVVEFYSKEIVPPHSPSNTLHMPTFNAAT